MIVHFTIHECTRVGEEKLILEAAGHWALHLPYQYAVNGGLGAAACAEYERLFNKKAVCKRISAKTISLEVAQ